MKPSGLSVLLLASLLLGCSNSEDYSTPKAAARTFYIAIMRGDTARAKAAVCDATQANLIEDMQGLISAILATQEAAEARFGDSGKSVNAGMPSLDDLQQATETIQGDTADVTTASTSLRRIHLKKVDGHWKVDLCTSFRMRPESAKRTVQSLTRAISGLPQQIKAGQYKTAQEAEMALQRSFAILALGELLPNIR